MAAGLTIAWRSWLRTLCVLALFVLLTTHARAQSTRLPLDRGEAAVDTELARPAEQPELRQEESPWVEWEHNDASRALIDSRFSRFSLRDIFPPSNGRHRGLGFPLEHESWLNRPLSFGFYGGGLNGSPPLIGSVTAGTGFLTGFRFGVDTDHFWGAESRIGFGGFGLNNQVGSARLGELSTFLMDGALLWYPLGDTKWRPYTTIGMGLADYRFYNETAQFTHQTVFNLPIGLGLKYRHNQRWALRFDFIDNLSFDGGSQIDTMNNFQFTTGLEARFGFGPSRSYYPWNPSRAY